MPAKSVVLGEGAAEQWDKLSAENKQKITDILHNTGLVEKSGTITANPISSSSAGGAACHNLCGQVAQVAQDQCDMIDDPATSFACSLAVAVAYDACNKACPA